MKRTLQAAKPGHRVLKKKLDNADSPRLQLNAESSKVVVKKIVRQ